MSYPATSYQQQGVVYQQAPTAIVYQQPAVMVTTTMPVVANNDWSTGLFDMTNPDCSMCIEGWLCGYCQMGYQYQRIRSNVIGMDAAVCAGALCCDAFCTGGLVRMGLTWSIRSSIQMRYGIRQDCCNDFCAVFCCNPCALCQQHREMSMHGEYPGGVLTNVPASNFAIAPPQAGQGMQQTQQYGAQPGYIAQPGYVAQPGYPAGQGYPTQAGYVKTA